ncbi:hypothetical protein BGX38DRAFT_1153394 [Terfezia claveryi]|nr:hypothetical protein BGX38DRAFT_1153394 [Terfezia claveryi]
MPDRLTESKIAMHIHKQDARHHHHTIKPEISARSDTCNILLDSNLLPPTALVDKSKVKN